MADRVYLEPLYLIPRLAMWVALLILAILDGLRHRHTKSRGWQLYAFLLLTCALFVLRDLILMLFALLHSPSSSSTSHPAVFGSFIFFSNCAESSWITDLLMISAGYMITRTSLGPHKTVVLLVPSIFFVTSLVTDFVFYNVAGSDAFSADPQTFYQAAEEGQIAASGNIIFFICLVASLMTYLLSWFYIFDTITQERQILEGLKDPIASGLDPSARRGATGGSSGYEGEGEGGTTGNTTTTTTTPPPRAAAVGHVALPPGGDVSMLLEPGSNTSHLYGDIIAEDLDARKTVADRVADKEKATLLQRFFIGVCAYVIASMASFLLPLFLPSVVDRTILAIQNVILWCFMAALLWTFKMREGNQYLALVEADNADTALVDDDDDDLNEDEDERAHTMEMGILNRGPTSHLGDNNNSGHKDAGSSSLSSASALPPRSLPPPPPPPSSSSAATSIPPPPPPPPPKPTSSPPLVVAAEPAFVLEDIDDDDDVIDEIILKDYDDDNDDDHDGTDEASDDVVQTARKTAHQD